MPIQVATNASFLTPELTNGILDIEIDFISFSVDVNNPEIYRKIRKNSDFEKVFANILYFLSEHKRRKALFPIIQVSAVKTQENTSFMREFINFWKNRVDRVRIYHAHSLEGDLGSLGNNDASLNRKPCLKLLTDMVIYWNGNVALCNHDWERDSFIGNVADSSIEGIWKSRLYEEIRQRHLDNRMEDFSPCNNCSHWSSSYEKNSIIGEIYEKI
jgi:radical SAM protein with 4Fe4S-binding SPASM domain